MTKQVVGTVKCHDCGAQIEQRVNRTGGVYANCDGEIDAKLCHASMKYSRPTSKRIIATQEGGDHVDHSDPFA